MQKFGFSIFQYFFLHFAPNEVTNFFLWIFWGKKYLTKLIFLKRWKNIGYNFFPFKYLKRKLWIFIWCKLRSAIIQVLANFEKSQKIHSCPYIQALMFFPLFSPFFFYYFSMAGSPMKFADMPTSEECGGGGETPPSRRL